MKILFQMMLATALFVSSGKVLSQEKPRDDAKLVIAPLYDNFYVYTTYNYFSGSKVPSNSMYLVTTEGVVLFDTPWDTTQFQPLLDSILARHGKKAVLCIATHFHADRTAGLAFYQSKGIRTYTTRQTYTRCEPGNRSEFILDKDSSFRVGGYSFETYYPGPGHSPDNIIIWVAGQKILYGGCFVKSTESTDLGNLGDANVKEWPRSVRNVMKKCKGAKYIIPGHFSWESNRSLEYTLELLKKGK